MNRQVKINSKVIILNNGKTCFLTITRKTDGGWVGSNSLTWIEFTEDQIKVSWS